jgi:hypothetical protein
MLFGKKFAALEGRNAAMAAMLAAVGFSVSAEAEPEVGALKAHFDKMNATTQATADAAVAQAKVYADGLAAAGVKLETVSVEGIKAAIDATLGMRSAKQIAQAGHPAAIDTPKAADTPAADASAMSQEELAAAIGAEKNPAKRKELYTQFEKRFWR